MAGEEDDDKENTPVHGRRKKGEEVRTSLGRSGGRRLSLSGSKTRPRYLKDIARKFQLKAATGRGRLTKHRPLQVDVSPYNFKPRSKNKGRKRNSFVVFEDDVISEPAHSQFSASLSTLETISGDVRASNVTLEERIMLNGQVRGGQNTAGVSVQQMPQKYVIEDFQTFQARNKAVVAAIQKSSLANLQLKPLNYQELGSTHYLKRVAARWQRGGRGKLYTKPTPLDTSEIMEQFRKMDDEYLQIKEMPDNSIQIKDLQEDQELVVVEVANETWETAQKCIQEEAHFENFPAEHLNSQDCDLLSPVEDGLEGERHLVQIDLMTPGPNNPDGIGMKDQEAILAGVSPTILELGDTPETSVAERGRQADPVSVSLSCASDYKQVTLPIHHMLFPASDQAMIAENEQTPPANLLSDSHHITDLDTYQESDHEKVEWTVAQTVEAVQMWSVELDPSRRRRESLQYFSSRPSPWLTRLAVCSFPSQDHVSIAEESRWQPSSMSVDHSENALQSDVDKPSTSSSLKFVSPHQQGNKFLETPEGMCLQTPVTDHGERNLRTEEPVRFLDFRASSASDHVSADELAKEEHQKSIRTQMGNPGDSEGILDSRRLSWSQEAPGSSHPCLEEPAETLNEKTSESSLESPTPQTAEQFRGDDCVDTATPSMEPITPTPVGTSPTPPTNPLSVYGFPYRRVDRERVGRKWLGFCSPPCTLSGVGVETMQIQKADSAPVHPPMSFEAEMSIQLQQSTSTQSGEDVLPVAEEEDAASSEDNIGVMEYSDVDVISDDTTCIVQTGASSSHNDQEGTSALKEHCPEEEAPDKDQLCRDSTPVRDFLTSPTPLVDYPQMHLEEAHVEQHIEQFVNSLQVTPGVNDAQVEGRSATGDDGADVGADVEIKSMEIPAEDAEEGSEAQELATPTNGKNKDQAEGECPSGQQQTKKKRVRRTNSLKPASPLDAGSKWSNGQRKSTRIRSKPLEWWRGEKMLYGRVHSTLNTLIGIKHLSPDPVWPRPQQQDRKNKAPGNYKVESFVPAKYNDLIRLAAQ